MQLETKIIDARLHDYLPQYATPEAAAIDLRACSRDGAQKAKRAAALREELARLEES